MEKTNKSQDRELIKNISKTAEDVALRKTNQIEAVVNNEGRQTSL